MRTRELSIDVFIFALIVIFIAANCYRPVVYFRGDVSQTLKYNGF